MVYSRRHIPHIRRNVCRYISGRKAVSREPALAIKHLNIMRGTTIYVPQPFQQTDADVFVESSFMGHRHGVHIYLNLNINSLSVYTVYQLALVRSSYLCCAVANPFNWVRITCVCTKQKSNILRKYSCYLYLLLRRICNTAHSMPQSLLNQIKLYSPATCILGYLCSRYSEGVAPAFWDFDPCWWRSEGHGVLLHYTFSLCEVKT